MANVISNISVGLTSDNFQDIVTHWMDQSSPVQGVTLTAAITATDTTITVASPGTIAVGDVIVVDKGLPTAEPLIVSAIDGSVITVARGSAISSLIAATTHASGGQVYKPTFPDVYKMVVAQTVIPYIQSVTMQLGARSATFGYTASGNVTTS